MIAQGRHREVGSEGSAEQNRDLTNRKRIRGIRRRDERATDREVPIHQGKGCRSGRCAGKAARLTRGDLRRVPESGLGEP